MVDCYVFRHRENGWITVSRHMKPDFCAGLSPNQINNMYEVIPVTFKERDQSNPQLSGDE